MKRKIARAGLCPALLATLTAPVFAAAEPESPETDPVETMVIVASKTPRPLQDVAGTVRVLETDTLNGQLSGDFDQILRYEPALGAVRSGTRFGVTGINIRGIDGNRVAMEVDGVPVGDQFSVGNFSNAGGNLPDPGLIRRVEILNGPASTLYGSDAIGGVVAITTWDPDTLVANSGRDWTTRFSTGFHGENSSYFSNALAAWSGNSWGLLAAISLRDGEELDNQASSQLPSDPQEWDSSSAMIKITRDFDGSNRLRLTLNDEELNADTDIRSILGLGRFRFTTALRGEDRAEKSSQLLDYEFSGAGFDQGLVRIWRQNSKVQQLSFEERAAAMRPVRLRRGFDYQQETLGGEVNLFRTLDFGTGQHHLGLGLEYSETDTREFRDGLEVGLEDGIASHRILGETFPLRDFPNSETRELGIFLHDEITWRNSPWTLIPGLRYDRTRLEPEPDAIYLEDNPDSEVVSLTDEAVSPKLGLVYKINRDWSGFAQYARGFRAPPFEDANIGLDIPLFNIRALPNPDLDSETSDGFEIGLRRLQGDASFTLSAFWTDYDDFIETRARIGVDPDSGVLLFQSRNIDKARIYGLETHWQQPLDEVLPSIPGLSLDLGAYWSRGENRTTDQPLNSVSPPQAIVGLYWDSPDATVNLGLVGTFTRRQTRIDETGGSRFETPGSGVLDLLARWQLHPDWSVSAGIYNLGDKKYWRWSDVSGFAPDDPVIEVLSRPGRSLALTVSAQF